MNQQFSNELNHTSLKPQQCTNPKTIPTSNKNTILQTHSQNFDGFFFKQNHAMHELWCSKSQQECRDSMFEDQFLIEHKRVVDGIFREYINDENQQKNKQSEFSQQQDSIDGRTRKIDEMLMNLFAQNQRLKKQITKNKQFLTIFKQLATKIPSKYHSQYIILFYQIIKINATVNKAIKMTADYLQDIITSNIQQLIQIPILIKQDNTIKYQTSVRDLSLTILLCLNGFFTNPLINKYANFHNNYSDRSSNIKNSDKPKKYKVIRRRKFEEQRNIEIIKKRKINP